MQGHFGRGTGAELFWTHAIHEALETCAEEKDRIRDEKFSPETVRGVELHTRRGERWIEFEADDGRRFQLTLKEV